MKPINEMTLQEVLHNLRFSNFYDELSVENTCKMQADVADRIHDLTRWIPVEERLPTKEDGDGYDGEVLWSDIGNPEYIGNHSVSTSDWNRIPSWQPTHWRRIDKPEGV